MLKFLHLSDLHISSSSKKNETLAKRLVFINQNYPSHAKIITGDVTDDGSLSQYVNAMYLLLQGDVYACPGNHDYGYCGNFYDRTRAARFDVYLPQAQAYTPRWSRPVVHALDDDKGTRVVLIGLDSNLRTSTPFDFACGKIGLWQRWWLKRMLQSYRKTWPDCVRIVYFHHHPFDRSPWHEMKDAKKLMAVLKGRCEVVLFGHRHRPAYYNQDHPEPWLAAGKLAECDVVREITVDGSRVSTSEVPVV